MSSVVHIDPEILGGTPVFRGTRVPIQALFDYLAHDYKLSEFFVDFPGVQRDQVIGLLRELAELSKLPVVAA